MPGHRQSRRLFPSYLQRVGMAASAPRRKLIEVSIPLEAINAASAREKSIRHGHPSTLHLWWAAPAATQPAPAPTLDLATGDAALKPLKPWIEVALPHPDVLANRFKEAEFAADLFAVDSGNAEGDYATPRGFFGITFLTEGLKR